SRRQRKYIDPECGIESWCAGGRQAGYQPAGADCKRSDHRKSFEDDYQQDWSGHDYGSGCRLCHGNAGWRRIRKSWRHGENFELAAGLEPGISECAVTTLGRALAEPVDGAVLVFRGESAEVVEQFAKSDPYVLNGLVKQWRVRKWNTVIGNGATVP